MALVLAVLLAFLAVDQATALHGNVPHWPVFYLPVLVTTFGCLVALTRGTSVQRLVGVSLGLLIFFSLLHVLDARRLNTLGWQVLPGGPPGCWRSSNTGPKSRLAVDRPRVVQARAARQSPRRQRAGRGRLRGMWCVLIRYLRDGRDFAGG